MSGYRFDPLRGKIATNPGPSIPEGLSATTIKEPAKLIWAQTPHPSGPGFWDDYPRNIVKKYQTFFQKPDGVPVHLKKGLKDRGTYRLIMGLTFVGSAWACYTLVKMMKKKN